jgi:hypothetical protein
MIEAPSNLNSISKRISDDFDAFCIQFYKEDQRTHLGASVIGRQCERYLWYLFRWCFVSEKTGRQLRLLDRGRKEEDRYVEWLRGMGFVIDTINHVTEKQFTVSAVGGHFGGSLDGKGFLPVKYNFKEKILYEFKTNKTGSSFNNLKAKGVAIEKQEHFSQTNVYGYLDDINYCLYMNVNKNDDDVHIELVKLNKEEGKRLCLKAEKIITSQTPPRKISESSVFFDCKFCDAKHVCHFNKEPERNCRSCKFAEPNKNKVWHCNMYANDIPTDFIPVGCQNWFSINK